jgi:hypothetical protein
MGGGPRAAVQYQWEQLLDYIEAGTVVPIVGQGLLNLEVEGTRKALDTYLAERLATGLAERTGELPPLQSSTCLSAVVSQHKARGPQGENLPYTLVWHLLRALEPLEPPESLLKLARLPFPLFVSTTCDSYVSRAVDLVRFRGRGRTTVPPYHEKGKEDLPDTVSAQNPVVFPLLGLASKSPDYALTEEDVLEFVHHFHRSGQPKRLFEWIQKRHVLLIGGGFSDWLVRFLVRLMMRERLWANRCTHFVADPAVNADPALATFLQHRLSDVQVFQAPTAESFVDELFQRWCDRPGTALSDAVEDTSETQGAGSWSANAERDETAPKRIFLSYASEDREAAQRIFKLLDAEGLEVWFDTRGLEPGDVYKETIRSQIRRSWFFVPVLSQHTLTPLHRFFRFEWTVAGECAETASRSVGYAFPLVIDDTPQTSDGIPEFLSNVHWTKAPRGDVPVGFVQKLRESYRTMERAERQRS